MLSGAFENDIFVELAGHFGLEFFCDATTIVGLLFIRTADDLFGWIRHWINADSNWIVAGFLTI